MLSKLKQFAYAPVLISFFICLVIFTLFRVGLCIWHYDLVKDNLLTVFTYGLRYDLSILSTLFALSLLLRVLNSLFKSGLKPIIFLERIILTACVSTVLVTELTTPSFILEYGVRPNHIYVEYLIYPKEVVSMLIQGHTLECVVFISILCIFAYLYFSFTKKLFANIKPISIPLNILGLIVFTLIFGLCVRGTLGHKPLNPSNASFSNVPLANTIPYDSLFNIFYELRHLGQDDVKGNQIYAFATENEVLDNLQYLSARTVPTLTKECPINQIIAPSIKPLQKRNVVIVLMESFGARYVKSLGGDDIAPNFEMLKEQGWFFERMYAAGHRSVRGIEAVTASMPISPLPSIVKLTAQNELTTIFSVYKKLGYNTSFIYGGESHFDNMRRYFFGNGVDHITEQKDYKNPKFVSSWGVSDEDLFERANQNFVKLSKEGKPFASIVFTSSFHDPFDIPEGKVNIDGIKTDDPKRLLAAKYADYALGKFFEQAQKEEYYKNTVFVVIADHDSRVRGLDSFPLTNYSIPALIISPDITPHKDNRVVSQIDIMPTLFSITGVQGQIPSVGQDLTRSDIIQRALIAYNEIFGVLDAKINTLTILQPQEKSQLYEIKPGNRISLIKSNMPKIELKKEISFENLGLVIFKNEYNKLSCVKGLEQVTLK